MPDSIASISEKSETTHGKSVPFRVARTLEEERGRREIVDYPHTELLIDGIKTGAPYPSFVLATFGLTNLIPVSSSGS